MSVFTNGHVCILYSLWGQGTGAALSSDPLYLFAFYLPTVNILVNSVEKVGQTKRVGGSLETFLASSPLLKWFQCSELDHHSLRQALCLGEKVSFNFQRLQILLFNILNLGMRLRIGG